MEYKNLFNYYQKIKNLHLADVFKQDPNRVKNFSIEVPQLFYDFSRNHIDEKGVKCLIDYANSFKLAEKIQQLMLGKKLNTSEYKPALHTALRDFTKSEIIIDGVNIVKDITGARNDMQQMCERIHGGMYYQQDITDVVCLGIGGSFWGTYLVCDALSEHKKSKLKLHFLSHLDSRKVKQLKQELNPNNTLVCMASKSFSTQEIFLHAAEFLDWYATSNLEDKYQHFIALTMNTEQAQNFGIEKENIIPIWDFVGGRFSVWSAIGLPIALAYGFETFLEFLQGAAAMDQHFGTAPFKNNIPVMQALLDVWYANFFAAKTRAILPYDSELKSLIPYIQQLAMESNGKSVTHDGRKITTATTPIFWGENGGDSQHAFNQMLFQGTQCVPADFIVCLNKASQINSLQRSLIASCLSQASALMHGFNDQETFRSNGYQFIRGNQPSNIILLNSLTPNSLGALMAMFEHRIFVASVLWEINAFDQWGVELGKKLYPEVLSALSEDSAAKNSSITDILQLLTYIKSKK